MSSLQLRGLDEESCQNRCRQGMTGWAARVGTMPLSQKVCQDEDSRMALII
jgi:hypothetical protein